MKQDETLAPGSGLGCDSEDVIPSDGGIAVDSALAVLRELDVGDQARQAFTPVDTE